MMKINHCFHYLILAGLFLLPLTPLIVSTSFFFPYITGKAFFFRIVVEIIFTIWIALVLLNPKYRPRWSAILISLLVLIVVITLATIFGAQPYHSFWSNFERMEGLIAYLHLFAYFLVLTMVLRTEKLWQWLLSVSLAVSLIVGFVALREWWGSTEVGFRADASLGNPIYLAVYALLHFFLALLMLLRSKINWQKIVLSLVGVSELAMIYLSGTRSAILGVAGGLFIGLLLIILFERERRRLRRWSVGILILVILIAGGFWLGRNSSLVQSNSVLSRLANISLQEGTARDRLLVWGIGIKGFEERPILGWGPENFNLVFNKYYNPNLYGAESWFDRSHNIFIDWLVHAGIFGLLAYLALFVVVIYSVWRKKTWSATDKSVVSGLVTAYLIHNFFVFDNLVSYLLFFALLAYLNHEEENKIVVSKTKEKFTSVSPLAAWSIFPLSIVLIFVIYFFNARQISASRNLVLATSFSPSAISDPQVLDQAVVSQINLFRKVLDGRTMASGEASEQLMPFSAAVLRSPQVSNDRKQELAIFTIQKMSEQAQASPLDARRQLFLGVFLRNVGQLEEGLKYLERASTLSPNKQQVLFELGSTYWRAGKKDQALAVARRAYELNPEVEDAKKFYEEVEKNF